jgi:hypothetical protein
MKHAGEEGALEEIGVPADQANARRAEGEADLIGQGGAGQSGDAARLRAFGAGAREPAGEQRSA